MNTMTRVGVLLSFAAAMFPAPVNADETADQSPIATKPADDSAASERYAKLIEQVEGPGRSCAIAQTTKAGLELAEAFVKAAKFIDVDPAKLLCFRYYSATLKYRLPTSAAEPAE